MVKSFITTIFSKSLIILSNLLLTILTTHFWGAEGKGLVSILISNIAIIAIFSNILGGSSVSFYLPKLGISNLILPAYIWIFIISITVSITINCFINLQSIWLIIVLAFLNSAYILQLSVFTGKNNINLYNTFSVLLPILQIIFIVLIKYIFKQNTINIFYISYALALAISWISGQYLILKQLKPNQIGFSFHATSKVFKYGIQTELSYLLQFLNYRLSYFFILYYIDIQNVGLFSVGIAIAESVWTISKSISIVTYSKIINSNNSKLNTNLTVKASKLSLYSSLIITIGLCALPSVLYSYIFGAEFYNIKHILYLLTPGILFISLSNIYGHYFSAIGNAKLLIIKSAIGVIFTVILSILLIPKWGITGACITASMSYLVSSIYIIFKFYNQPENNFKWIDWAISKKDLII